METSQDWTRHGGRDGWVGPQGVWRLQVSAWPPKVTLPVSPDCLVMALQDE